jgi:hypothetical protein
MHFDSHAILRICRRGAKNGCGANASVSPTADDLGRPTEAVKNMVILSADFIARSHHGHGW